MRKCSITSFATGVKSATVNGITLVELNPGIEGSEGSGLDGIYAPPAAAASAAGAGCSLDPQLRQNCQVAATCWPQFGHVPPSGALAAAPYSPATMPRNSAVSHQLRISRVRTESKGCDRP